jgi:hypothetical protein
VTYACNTFNKKCCFVEEFGVCKEGFEIKGGGAKVICYFHNLNSDQVGK